MQKQAQVKLNIESTSESALLAKIVLPEKEFDSGFSLVWLLRLKQNQNRTKHYQVTNSSIEIESKYS